MRVCAAAKAVGGLQGWLGWAGVGLAASPAAALAVSARATWPGGPSASIARCLLLAWAPRCWARVPVRLLSSALVAKPSHAPARDLRAGRSAGSCPSLAEQSPSPDKASDVSNRVLCSHHMHAVFDRSPGKTGFGVSPQLPRSTVFRRPVLVETEQKTGGRQRRPAGSRCDELRFDAY